MDDRGQDQTHHANDPEQSDRAAQAATARIAAHRVFWDEMAAIERSDLEPEEKRRRLTLLANEEERLVTNGAPMDLGAELRRQYEAFQGFVNDLVRKLSGPRQG